VKLAAVLNLLDGEVLSRQAGLDRTFTVGFGADLMSDVLAFAPAGALLLTGLANPQVVRTAEMAGIRAIVLVRAKEPPAETVRLADEVDIPVIATRYTLYEACGRLYAAGLGGIGPLALYSLREDVPGGRSEQAAG
jgi:predicted transcriptional regulator